MRTINKFRLPRRVALTSALVLVAAATVIACETPVYRFAMYRWEPAAYSVYYLHTGEPSAEHQGVLERFDDLQFGEETNSSDSAPTESVNVDVIAVETSDGDTASQLPEAVAAAWQEAGGTLPTFLVYAPGGRLLHAGELTVADVDAMIDSPTRQTVARLLDVEHVAVFYLLESEDDAANDAARRTIRDVIDLADAGALVADDPLSGVLAVDEDDDQTMLLATVTVSRDDPAERWLVRMLLGIEDDLSGLSEPMVFPVFGRGRALEPFIGRGITTDNLAGAVTYVTGSCSCEIKEQNPGMDLLTRWDWTATAEALAERVGEEEGNRGLITDMELFPTIIVASGRGIESADEATTATEPDTPDSPSDDATLKGDATLVATATAADVTADNVATDDVATDDVETTTDAGTDAPSVTGEPTDATADDTSTAETANADWTVAVTPEAAADTDSGSAADNESADFGHRWTRNLMLGGGLAIVALVLVSLALLKSRPSV